MNLESKIFLLQYLSDRIEGCIFADFSWLRMQKTKEKKFQYFSEIIKLRFFFKWKVDYNVDCIPLNTPVESVSSFLDIHQEFGSGLVYAFQNL